MKVLGYFTPLTGFEYPTGVSCHAYNIFATLTRRLADDFRIASFKTVQQGAEDIVRTRCPGCHFEKLGISETWAYHLTTYLRYPVFDNLSTQFDWVYAPKELPVVSRKMKVALTIHDLLPFEREHRWYAGNGSLLYRLRWRWILKRITQGCDLIFTVSQFTKNRILSFFPSVSADKIVPIGNGASSLFFRHDAQNSQEALEHYGLRPHQYILFSGGLQMRKGGDLVIRMVERLRARGLGFIMVVTGRRHDSQFMPFVEAATKRAGDSSLRLLGYVPQEDLVPLLHHAFALVFPSRYEGFGLPAIEAMAAGCPVIYHAVTALPEVVGDAGIPVTDYSEGAFLDAIQRLAEDPNKRDELIALGKNRAEQFSWESCVDRLLNAMSSR